jgi:DNA-binding GntR family transcriptional regulator
MDVRIGVDRAEEAILDWLARGSAKPGERVVESRLSAEIKLNRAAVREALARLAAGGIVEYVPYSGYRLPRRDTSDLLELYDLREAIEPISARNAAELGDTASLKLIDEALRQFARAGETGDDLLASRSDRDFHLAIVQASGNWRFKQIYQRFRVEPTLIHHLFRHTNASPTLRPSQNDDVNGFALTLESHQAIFDAIRRRRPFDAHDLTAEHIFWARSGFVQDELPLLVRKHAENVAEPSMEI